MELILDIEDRKRAESLLAAEKRTLEKIASNVSLTDVLEDLCDSIDVQSPPVISSVMLVDSEGRRLSPAAGHRVPKGWAQAIAALPIGPCMGSCGTAACTKQQVIIADITNDPLWSGNPAEGYRAIALRYGLRATWSQPLISKENEVLGTFAMYFTVPRSPTSSDLRAMQGAAHLALLAIQTNRSQTALQRAYQEIKEFEARLRKIIDTIPTLASCNLPDGTGEFWNRRWHDYTGLSPEAARGWGWQDATHPEDLNEITYMWLRSLESGQPGEMEGRLRRFDGEYRWFLFRAEPLRDESGNMINWYGTYTDIDDLKQHECELRRMTNGTPQANATPQVIVAPRPDGTGINGDHVALENTDLTLAGFQAERFRDQIVEPDNLGLFRKDRKETLAREQPFEIEQRAPGKDEKHRRVLNYYKPRRHDQTDVTRYYSTAADMQHLSQADENLALREQIGQSVDEIVGSSEPLRHVLSQVARVARTDSTVLLLGETGTGKELIARAIHNRSNRSSRAFIRVNCAAIPSSLIASELFGHEKGAFTGALQRRLGRFEAAEEGTIFLDEIGEVPGETQLALLQVLQEHEIERIGRNQPLSVNVRVVSATNRDLEAAVAAGAFRRDLFYRLNVFPIQIPSLRERVDDIPLLVEYLIERYASNAGKKIRYIKKRTLELFRSYDWPGNIRELQNVVQRAVICCDDGAFSIDETWLKNYANTSPVPSISHAADPASTERELVSSDREMIEAALQESHGRISGPSGAATRLGIPRQTLDSRIRSLRINKHRFKTA